jgi:hypothetical protein
MRRGTVAALALVCAAVGCTARSGPQRPETPPTDVADVTPVVIPTVPPSTPLPPGATAVPLKTRPVKNPQADAARKAGKVVGPVITWAGLARADGYKINPSGKNAQGYPIFNNAVGSGFMIVVEAKPGISNLEVGRSIFRHDENDATARPDLEIEVNRPLGDGSPDVCDARKPKIGGVPAINPPSFDETPKVSAALNDMSCRFETFIESNASCTVDASGDFSYRTQGNPGAVLHGGGAVVEFPRRRHPGERSAPRHRRESRAGGALRAPAQEDRSDARSSHRSHSITHSSEAPSMTHTSLRIFVVLGSLWLAGCGGCNGDKPPPPAAATPTAAAAAPAAAAGATAAVVPEEGGEVDCFVIVDAEPDFGAPPLTVNFTTETDCTGSPVTFSWDFGDGKKGGNEPNPSHTYEAAGDYVAVVTTTAPDGGSGSDEIDITVDPELAE